MTTRAIAPAQFQVSAFNPCGLDGIEFVEFVSSEPEKLDALFKGFGLSKTMRHASRPVDLYQQGDIAFLVNREPASFAAQFGTVHGPSICSMGWRVKDAKKALAEATARGAKTRPEGDFLRDGKPVPAIFGIGDSLIYFIDRAETAPFALEALTFMVDYMQVWRVLMQPAFGWTGVTYRVVKFGDVVYLASRSARRRDSPACAGGRHRPDTRRSRRVADYLSHPSA